MGIRINLYYEESERGKILREQAKDFVQQVIDDVNANLIVFANKVKFNRFVSGNMAVADFKITCKSSRVLLNGTTFAHSQIHFSNNPVYKRYGSQLPHFQVIKGRRRKKKKLPAYKKVISLKPVNPKLKDIICDPYRNMNIPEFCWPRIEDSESKILESLIHFMKLHKVKNPKGEIHLYTDREPCMGCESKIMEFITKYKDIDIFIYYKIGYEAFL
ncbi:deaminase domain-containing protein [Peribacillus simplex]|uniref:deaminase domain-containing protein n=1 Tax=Peribacillus simplex TaxID=1478 RepID=UPI002E1C2813|nr:deaminase domain-containing protein [Peribacillus simplex]MED4094253.1 deaminase domain-containing protein [Peribacillus simplex]